MLLKSNRIFLSMVVLALTLVTYPVQSQEDRIIAVVNDELITLSELKNYVTTSYMGLIQKGLSSKELEKLKVDLEINGLNRLIDDKLVLGKATEMGVKISPRAIEERINAIKIQYPSEQMFIDALTESGTTLADLKNKFSEQIKIKTFMDAVLKSRVVVNPNETIRYYKEHLDDYWVKDMVELDSIFIAFTDDKAAARERFDKAVAELQSGEDFFAVAEKHSDSPSIGVVKKGDLVPEIENVVFKLPEGRLSPAIETDSGYYLFRVKKKTPMEVIAFNKVKDKIKEQLYQQKVKDEYNLFLDELKKEAYVEIKK